MLDLFIETAVVTISLLLGGFLIEKRFRICRKLFVKLKVVKPVFQWLIIVLIGGSLGGFFTVLTENVILRIGGNEVIAGIGSSVVFGFFFGILIHGTMDSTEKDA